MGKGTKIPEAAAKKLRQANRKLISSNKDKAAKKAYATVAKRNPLLRAAMIENLKKLGVG